MTQLSATPTVTKLALHRETLLQLMGSQALEERGVPAVKSKKNYCDTFTCTCGQNPSAHCW